jgi:ATP-dependent helicase/nuclease subunit B
MSVSAFGDYLRCPFRFYLKHALHMASLDDRAFELDPADFGSLCHAVLKAFYDNEQLRDSTDSRRIAAFLKETVERLAAERFCQSRSAAVAFQLATLTQRLEAFADKQAEHRAAGWRIIHAELSFGGDKQHGFHIGNMPIRGRIDRIDRDERTGAHLLLDYKTSDSSEQPADTHLANPSQFPELPAWATVHANGRRWVDLQLPLYCLYAQYARMENVQVGYVNLPKAATQTRFAIWEDLDADLLDAARRCAEGVVERVRNGVFWPPRKGVDCWEDDSIRALLVRGAEHAVKPWEQWTQAVLDETGAQVHS